MQVFDGRVRTVWFDHVEDALHLTSRNFHYTLTAWPQVVARESDRNARTWSRVRRPLRIDLGPPSACDTRKTEQLTLDFFTPRRVFGAQALASYRERIPHRVVAAIAAWPDFHGELLEFAAGGAACVDLLVGNPALVALLLPAWDFHDVSYGGALDQATRWVASGMRQVEVLQHVGIAAGEALPRLLRKIPAWCLDRMTAGSLADAVKSPDLLPRLHHLPVITGAVLQVVATSTVRCVSDRFLRELQALSLTEERHLEPRIGPSQRAVFELETLMELWHEYGPDALPRIDSIAGLGRQRGDFDVAVGRRDLLKGATGPLPDAPFPGNDDIDPITTREGLLEESERQRHCVASYGLSIENRWRAVYRVRRPQRATLLLRKRYGAWEIEEMRGRANAAVRPETAEAVQSWFRGVARCTRAGPPRGS